MADKVWAETQVLPGRKILLTKAQFKVYARNGWTLADPPAPPDPEDEAKLDAAVEATKKAGVGRKPAPEKPVTKRVQKKKSSAAKK